MRLYWSHRSRVEDAIFAGEKLSGWRGREELWRSDLLTPSTCGTASSRNEALSSAAPSPPSVASSLIQQQPSDFGVVGGGGGGPGDPLLVRSSAHPQSSLWGNAPQDFSSGSQNQHQQHQLLTSKFVHQKGCFLKVPIFSLPSGGLLVATVLLLCMSLQPRHKFPFVLCRTYIFHGRRLPS